MKGFRPMGSVRCNRRLRINFGFLERFSRRSKVVVCHCFAHRVPDLLQENAKIKLAVW